MELENTFNTLLLTYTGKAALTNKFWEEIESQYNGTGRYYHNMKHLESLLIQLTEISSTVADWDAVLFAVFYHDIVYDVQRTDNEEQSAVIAGLRMEYIGVPPERITNCKQIILATRSHQYDRGEDVNLFTDADLSILGQDPQLYDIYCDHVRNEYACFPDAIYMPARKKVLENFLQMNRIFKTDHFHIKFEIPARQNLQSEIDRLHLIIPA